MRKRYKMPLSFTGILLVFVFAIGLIYLFYDKLFKKDISIIVKDYLSINYITGSSFNQNTDKEIKFSITNSSNNESNYSIKFTNIETNDNITFTLKKENEVLQEDKIVNNYTIDNINIDAKTTQNFILIINANENSIYKGKLEITSSIKDEKTFSEILIQKGVNEDSKTQIGTISTEDEGLIKTIDDEGISYYFRGNVTNNYVSLADNTWRIIRINGDGSVRMILDGELDTVSSYYKDTTNYSYNNSNIKKDLDTWYEDNLSEYADIISNQKYCNDLTKNDEGYISYNRVMKDNIISLNCLGEKISLNIGLITIDEAILSGLSKDSANKNYLINDNIKNNFYTMTSAKSGSYYYPFLINIDGSINTTTSGNLLRGVRPVINITKNVTTTGSGTSDDPYQIISLDKSRQ